MGNMRYLDTIQKKLDWWNAEVGKYRAVRIL